MIFSYFFKQQYGTSCFPVWPVYFTTLFDVLLVYKDLIDMINSYFWRIASWGTCFLLAINIHCHVFSFLISYQHPSSQVFSFLIGYQHPSSHVFSNESYQPHWNSTAYVLKEKRYYKNKPVTLTNIIMLRYTNADLKIYQYLCLHVKLICWRFHIKTFLRFEICARVICNFTGKYNARILRIKNAKFRGYWFYMNTNINGDF